MEEEVRIAFAGDRDIAVWVFSFILEQNVFPHALIIPFSHKASHAHRLLELCSFLPRDRIIAGDEFRGVRGISLLKELNLDYIICIHFPYIVPKGVLNIPRYGVLNLHPAYLPYNRGWHTPSWAILEETPIGATLHFMDEGIDSGDIIHRKLLEVTPKDTAHSLYKRLKDLEFEVFKEAWPILIQKSFQRIPQDPTKGTVHKREDLFKDTIQRFNLDETVRAGDLLRRLRGLTTNRIDESAYFEKDGMRYRVQVVIHEQPESEK